MKKKKKLTEWPKRRKSRHLGHYRVAGGGTGVAGGGCGGCGTVLAVLRCCGRRIHCYRCCGWWCVEYALAVNGGHIFVMCIVCVWTMV